MVTTVEAVGKPVVRGEARMQFDYLIRYGLWRQVGRFAPNSPSLERGQRVVVRSHRGTELGEILIKVMSPPEKTISPAASAEAPQILRPATPDDFELARRLELQRPRCFELCQRAIQECNEAIELLDVEPLLDEPRTVLYYLGPRQVDAARLVATLRSTCNLDAVLEPIGRDGSEDIEVASSGSGPGCGHCGLSGGGCNSGSHGAPDSDSSHGACSDCGIKRLLQTRRPLISC
jgi:hypothetical protein